MISSAAKRRTSPQAERDATEDANRVRGFDDHRSVVVPWLRETGIVDHVSGLKKDEIRAAITIPSPSDDSALRRIIDATDSMLREAHRWCFGGPRCMLTWPCRAVLGRFQSSQNESFGKIRPFDPYKEPGTLQTYISLAHRALAYFDRVVAGDEDCFSGETEESTKPEDIVQPSEEQLVAWKDIRTLAGCKPPAEQEAEKDQLKCRLIEFWVLLVCQNTGSQRYFSPLLSFCAMLSITPSTQGWIGPGDFNSHLSGIIWVVQLLFFFDSARKEKDGGGETLAQVKQYCERYLQQTVETPMGEILRWRLLLFRVSKDTVGDHAAFWDKSEQVLTYEDVEWHMDQIPTLLESEYRDCRRLLYDDLMFGVTGILHMHAWTLRDSANVDTVGWDFTQHRNNGHLSMGVGMALLTAIERSDSISRLFLVNARQSSSGLAWRESALATSGQPLRESEFFAMSWRNTQRRRSITLCHERVVIHVRYHKGQQQTGRYKDNIRFLAQPIGDLLLDYIVYVMPLRQIFLRQQPPKALLSPFLWEKNGKVWADGQLSRYLGEASAWACVPRLHVSNWRQMTVAIVKTKFVSQISVFEANDQDEDAEEVDDNIRIMTGQRNHKTQTVNRAYANQIGAAYGNVWDGLIRMGLRFLGVEVTLKGQKKGRAQEESWLAKRVAMGVYRPRKPWSAEALLAGAKKLYGNDELGWKSAEQEQALTTIMSWTEQVVAILPTGAGKSLLFMLPCTLPDAGVTVLVVPLVSLRGDLLRRLRELRIDHIEWSSGERRESGLVLVTAEAASTKDL
ncbi:hypothetical protein LTR82_017684 [Friedmanniomyces endolithicus]|uniref:DEAD/DEAH-box helicase domain-containing protein n=1 Tax=Friedmanniomyces endolithicus TaxID=329885 RepID=A0AAN6F5A7_9PEZI|nr:hypothetical protein LTR82_017684 [Friedmanniomyces endolithicus]